MTEYDFRTLSPIDFEAFVRDLLNAELGTKLVNFAVGPDGGIDLRDNRPDTPTVVVQCKHKPNAKKKVLVDAAHDESEKLAGTQLDTYIFVVSAPLSPGAEDAVAAALAPIDASTIEVWHLGKLNEALARWKSVEEAHPKLWLSSSTALNQILHSAEWLGSDALVQRILGRAKLYVQTPLYAEARRILEDHNVLILTGPPGVGKSTLGEMLLLAHRQEGWRVANVASDIQEGWRQLRNDSQKTILFYDDFLGQTSTAELQKNESSSIVALLEKIQKDRGQHRIILTSREQIFRQAVHGLDDRLRRLKETESKLTINLTDVDRRNKAKILFNHMYFGFEDENVRAQLASDLRYLEVVDHKAFNPRILESTILVRRHKDIDSFYEELFAALENPEEIWAGSFRQLSGAAVEILLQLAMEPAPMDLDELRSAIHLDDHRDWIPTLKMLEGTWIRLNPARGTAHSTALFDASRRDFLLGQAEEEAFLISTLENLGRCSQFAHVLRLAGFIAGDSSIGGAERPILRKNLSGIVIRLDEWVLRIAKRNFDFVLQREDRRHALETIENGRESSTRVTTLQERVDALLALAELTFGTSQALPQSENLLAMHVRDFLQATRARVYPDPIQLFRLGAWLAEEGRPDWATDGAIKLVQLAFENINQSSDLLEYLAISETFRKGPFGEKEDQLLAAAIDSEIDTIRQQAPDFDLMESILNELESVAGEFGIDDGFATIWEEIEDIKGTQQDADSNHHYSAQTSKVQDRATDDDLRMMFSKLA